MKQGRKEVGKEMKEKRRCGSRRTRSKLAVLVWALAGILLFGACNDKNRDNNDDSYSGLVDFLNGAAGDGKTNTDEQFLSKVNYINALIDTYFLEETQKDELYEGMYKGLLESLGDPYSCYFTKEEYGELMESVEGVYCGIGALVSQNASTKVITIVRPFVDGPAYDAGMLPGDILTEIEGEDVSEWSVDLAVKRMKGEQGTTVDVKVWRPSESKYLEMTIIRDLIEVETVTYEMLDNEIGYISVMEFDEITVQQFETALNNLKKQGMKGLVVDIRDNPGGLLTTVCDMLDLFLEDGLIVYTVDKQEKRDEIFAEKGSIGELPMAVLINGNSASASEIFSGALQDYELATIVGTKSYGKGIVQSIVPLVDGSAVKLTVSTYYTPKGRSIHGEGVKPDVEIELEDELKKMAVVPLEEDNQVQAAAAEVRKKLK